MDVKVFLVDAFCYNDNGGNPAGVVLDADSLDETQMQVIAKEVGFSETAFVTLTSPQDIRIRYFTPVSEVMFCGHATLAAFFTLFSERRIGQGSYPFQTQSATLSVNISASGDVLITFPKPAYLGQLDVEEIAPLFNLFPEDLSIESLPIEVISTGANDVIVPVSSGRLDSVTPDFEAISKYCETHNLLAFHLFEYTIDDDEHKIHGRNFAPLVGINEECATGTANGALACYLTKQIPSLGPDYALFQGRAMGRESLIKVQLELDDDQVNAVNVGGKAKFSGFRTLKA
ncbi:PhzF family phenazine biosynthesis protein [Parasalinivibrio latis]|uniref:PhzF family phenazine biosynthesis protein n=1 Tax=Parasalinivibrio latis TaxID=2952610 RepID=UPI0030DE6C94